MSRDSVVGYILKADIGFITISTTTRINIWNQQCDPPKTFTKIYEESNIHNNHKRKTFSNRDIQMKNWENGENHIEMKCIKIDVISKEKN